MPWSKNYVCLMLPRNGRIRPFLFSSLRVKTATPYFSWCSLFTHSASKESHLPLPPFFRTTISIELSDLTLLVVDNFHHLPFLELFCYAMV